MGIYNYTGNDVHVMVAVNSAPISNSCPSRGVLHLIQLPKDGPAEDLDLGGNAKLRIRQLKGVTIDGDVATIEMGSNLIVASHDIALALWRDGYKGIPYNGRIFVPAPSEYAAEVELHEVQKPVDDQARWAELEDLRITSAENLKTIGLLIRERDGLKEASGKLNEIIQARGLRIEELEHEMDRVIADLSGRLTTASIQLQERDEQHSLALRERDEQLESVRQELESAHRSVEETRLEAGKKLLNDITKPATRAQRGSRSVHSEAAGEAGSSDALAADESVTPEGEPGQADCNASSEDGAKE